MKNKEFFDFDDDIEFNFDDDEIKKPKLDVKEKKSKKNKLKTKGLFDHLRAITTEDYDPEYFENMYEGDRKTFDVYMITRFLSMNPDWISYVNYFQQYNQFLSRKEFYKLYSSFIPKQKIFLNYVKGEADKYNKDLINLICRKYQSSKKEAVEYLGIFYKIPGGIEQLEELCKSYGHDEKETKKLIKI